MKERSLIHQYDKGGLAATYRAQALAREEQDDPTRTRIPQWLLTCNRCATLLDAGCGSGIDLARYHALGFFKLMGMDASVEQCKLASQALCGLSVPVICGDAAALPLRPARFDIVTSRYVLHYSKDPAVAVTGIAERLKTGGLFMCVIPHPDYDASRTDKHNGDGTITYTLFDRALSITYPLHPMEAYIGPTFGRYFTMLACHADPSPTLDDVKPQDRPALCFLARRNARPVVT